MGQAYLDFAASRPLPGAASPSDSRKPGRAALRTILPGAVMLALLAGGILLRLVAYLADFTG